MHCLFDFRPARYCRAARLSVGIVALTPSLVAAQRVTPSLEVGAATMRFADSVAASAGSFTPGLTASWARARLTAIGTYTQLANSGWSTQGLVDVSLFTPTAHLVSGELNASSGGSAHWDGTRTAQSIALGRAHVDANSGGIWAGGGLGSAWDGFTMRAMTLGDIGAWTRIGGATLMATLAPTRIGDTLRYLDSELSARWMAAAFELRATGGFRSGDRFPSSRANGNSWGSASILAHVTPYAGIIFSAGTYPIDLAQGFPGGRYVNLSLRLTTPSRRPAETQGGLAEVTSDGMPAAPRGIVSFELATAPNGGRRVLRIQAPGAQRVEINGDFTEWKPLALSASGDGWWVAVLSLAPGTHQAMIRVNAGDWEVPPGLLALRDEFGGSVGLWIVE